MKIIHTSDWHLGKVLNHYSLLEDQRVWLTRFCKTVAELSADTVIIAGDIYDRSVPPAGAVTLLSETLAELTANRGCTVIVIAGNHDSRERLGFGSEMLRHSGLHIVSRVTADTCCITLQDEHGPVHFYALPYCDAHTARQVLGKSGAMSQDEAVQMLCAPMLEKLDKTQRNILIAHGFFAAVPLQNHDGTEVGGSEMVSLKPMQDFDYIALGHIHAPQNTGLPNACYSGSPLKYSLSEANHQKQCILITMEGKGCLVKEDIHIPPYRDLQVLEGTFDEMMQSKPSHDYIFLNLTDPVPVSDAVSRLKAVYPNILGVRFTSLQGSLTEHAVSLHELESKDSLSLFTDFYKRSCGSDMTALQQETISRILNPLTKQ